MGDGSARIDPLCRRLRYNARDKTFVEECRIDGKEPATVLLQHKLNFLRRHRDQFLGRLRKYLPGLQIANGEPRTHQNVETSPLLRRKKQAAGTTQTNLNQYFKVREPRKAQATPSTSREAVVYDGPSTSRGPEVVEPQNDGGFLAEVLRVANVYPGKKYTNCVLLVLRV